MYSVLLKYQMPASFFQTWGPNSKMAGLMTYWIVGLVVCIGLAWWGLAPNVSSERRVVGWLSTLGALAFAGILALVGVGKLRFIQLHTYGVLVAIGFLIGIVLAVREAKRIGENTERILDLAFWLLIAAMIGARLSYIGIHWNEYAGDFAKTKLWYQWKVFRLWEGGLTFFGGFLFALIVCWMFVRLYNMDFWKLADTLIPSVAIGQFFGQLGSLAAGFSYGKASTLPWAITYPAGSPVNLSIPVHPTQLYEALGVLILFVALLWIRSEKRFHGQVFLWYLVLFPALSFFVEMFRGDECPMGVSKPAFVCRAMVTYKDVTPVSQGFDILSYGQLFAAVAFVLGLYFLFQRRNEAEAAAAGNKA